MYRYDWEIFVTDTLVRKLQGFSELEDPESIPRDLIADILASVGGFPYTEVQYDENERTQIGERLFHEAIKHTLSEIYRPIFNVGFIYSNSEDDSFEEEIVGSASIDINRATSNELEALPGVGSVLAERIVNERRKEGLYKSLEDVVERVDGIGRTFLLNAGYSSRFDAPSQRIGESDTILDNIESDFSNLLQLQDGETEFERFLAVLDMIASVCATSPHPSSLESEIRNLIPEFVQVDEQTDWLGILWSSNYYYDVPELIRASAQSVKVCMFHIAFPDENHPSHKLLEALVEVYNAGALVQVLLDRDRTNDPYLSTVINTPAKAYLEQQGVSCRFDKEDSLLHSKFIVIDKKLLILGSHNWSAGSYFHFDDLSLVVSSKKLAEQLSDRFDHLWDAAI